MASHETGVTTFNKILLSALCKGAAKNLSFVAYLSSKNALRFADLDHDQLTKVVLPSDYFYLPSLNTHFRRVIFVTCVIPALSFFCKIPRFSKLLERIYPIRLEHEDADLFIYTTYGHLPYVPIFLKLKTHKPLISVIHDVRYALPPTSGRTSSIDSTYLKHILRHSNAVVVTSSFIKNVIVEKYQFPEARIMVAFAIPFELREIDSERGSNLDHVKQKYLLPNRLIFYPSTIVSTKNHLRLLEALLKLKKIGMEINLILTGTIADKNLYKKIQDKISNDGLSNQVRHLGFVTEDEKIALYKLATAVVIPSIAESFSLPIWEAFLLGCPVLSSNAYDMPEQVEDAALLCDPFDVTDIAAKIARICKDAPLRAELIKKGHAITHKHSSEKFASKWRRLIEETVG